MMYVIADKTLASRKGFEPSTHRTNKNLILLNEKEIMNNNHLEGDTLEQRIECISGTVYSHAQIKHLINEGGWNE